ncbi:hypothetical protein VPNG_08070 [Cytospora leucostoma]|uniref:Uncharacterized protein n=1 Tax=Cytospora leucostoma TaxID=1230097 RepID=A0A423WSK2_9PEZI|nr:hypothetical protein VPNG_08070 [Cytospora leucostoma]
MHLLNKSIKPRGNNKALSNPAGIHVETQKARLLKRNLKTHIPPDVTAKLSHFLQRLTVLDFLFTCLAAGAFKSRPSATAVVGLPEVCPVAPEKLGEVIDTFPPIVSGMTASDLLLETQSSHLGGRQALIVWLCRIFKGNLFEAPERWRVPQMPTSKREFILAQTTPTRQKAFQDAMTANCQDVSGSAAFHGTSPHFVFRILCEDIKASPESKPFVYYAEEPAIAMGYLLKGSRSSHSSPVITGWKNSVFRGNYYMLLGVEVALDDIPFRCGGHKSPQEQVTVRYVFLVPEEAHPKCLGSLKGHDLPEGEELSEARRSMKRTHEELHNFEASESGKGWKKAKTMRVEASEAKKKTARKLKAKPAKTTSLRNVKAKSMPKRRV